MSIDSFHPMLETSHHRKNGTTALIWSDGHGHLQAGETETRQSANAVGDQNYELTTGSFVEIAFNCADAGFGNFNETQILKLRWCEVTQIIPNLCGVHREYIKVYTGAAGGVL